MTHSEMIRRLIVTFDGNTCDGLGIVAYSKVERSIHSNKS